MVKYRYLIMLVRFALFREVVVGSKIVSLNPQVLVLSPTRELAVQIQKVVLALGDYMNVQVYIWQLYLPIF